ncbi:MAG: hypothetical protein U9N78_10665 [Actinomycetota bacterium]|nr:hypothetical protein [Actinomycetota bacterium]
MNSKVKRIAVLMAGFSLLVAACGSASDIAGEKLAEELIEASVDGDVSVDVSGDGDDATVSVETDEGSMSFGAGTEMPDGLEIPVPDGGDVMSAFTAEDVINVSLVYEQGNFEDIAGFYDEWTDGTGDEWETQDLTMDSGDEKQRTSMWISDADESMIIVADCAGMGSETMEIDAVCVTVTQGG